MLRQHYGEMILKEGSILYHTSDEIFIPNKDKQMLFCLFHPSEWGQHDQFITPVILKRDISLAFLIENIKRLRLFSAVDVLTDNQNRKITKTYTAEKLNKYITYLRNENFDGWFSSIQNQATVEVALINDDSIFTILETTPLKRCWRNGFIHENVITTKDWRNKYTVCTTEKPAILKINKRFRAIIKDYLFDEIKIGYIKEYVFQVILDNAEIYYNDKDTDKDLDTDPYITWTKI